MDAQGLTFLTVLYNCDELFETNVEILCKLNPNCKINWILVKNDGHDFFDINLKLDRFRNQINFKFIQGHPNFFTPFDEGSYHHAAGIHFGLLEVSTRFLVIVDPDFYVVRPNWINELINHMGQNNLSFFGSVWDITNRAKQHDFPSVHFMAIDLNNIPIYTLDFTPILNKSAHIRSIANNIKAKMLDLKSRGFITISNYLFIFILILKRKCSFDTGYRIRKLFYRKSAFKQNYELLKFVPHPLFIGILEKTRKVFPRFLKNWLPGFLGLIPNKMTNKSGFIRKVDPIFYKNNCWEEFRFGKDPFAFHCRRVINSFRGTLDNTEMPMHLKARNLSQKIVKQYFNIDIAEKTTDLRIENEGHNNVVFHK